MLPLVWRPRLGCANWVPNVNVEPFRKQAVRCRMCRIAASIFQSPRYKTNLSLSTAQDMQATDGGRSLPTVIVVGKVFKGSSERWQSCLRHRHHAVCHNASTTFQNSLLLPKGSSPPHKDSCNYGWGWVTTAGQSLECWSQTSDQQWWLPDAKWWWVDITPSFAIFFHLVVSSIYMTASFLGVLFVLVHNIILYVLIIEAT